MKIAIVGGCDRSPAEAPVGEYEAELSAALAARGQEVTLYRRHCGKRNGHRHGYRLVEARVGPAAVLSPHDTLPYVSELAGSLYSAWSANRPDVVHAHGWVPGLAAQLAARRQRLPVVQAFHGLAARRLGTAAEPERRRLEPLLAKSAAWVAAGCTSDLTELAKFRHGRTRLSVVPGGVDIELFNPVGPAPMRERPHRVLAVGPNCLPANGFEDVIRAMAWIPDSELVIAETGTAEQASDDARTHLQRLAADLHVGDRVHLLGALAPAELPTLMRSADVVACAQRTAPDASVALQAMASGVAVVALAVDALADTVVHGVTGVLVPPDKPAEFTRALKSLQAQPFRCQGMGAAGRARVRSRYTWDRIATDSQNIYAQIAVAGRIDDVSSAQA